MTIAWRESGATADGWVGEHRVREAGPRGYRGKRLLDVAMAACLLVLLLPLLALVALLVRGTSPGGAVFRQERVGYGGRPFVIHKFRTMHVGRSDAIHRAFVRAQIVSRASATVPDAVHKLVDDPRVTGVGRWLRSTSIDELPQLWDVLRGDMSLVGPRPVLPWEAELLTEQERERFSVRPGITGLWQVSGRSRLTMPQAFALDCEYARRVSLLLDARLLLRTIVVVCRPNGSAR